MIAQEIVSLGAPILTGGGVLWFAKLLLNRFLKNYDEHSKATTKSLLAIQIDLGKVSTRLEELPRVAILAQASHDELVRQGLLLEKAMKDLDVLHRRIKAVGG